MPKKIPQRMCISCRKIKDKKDLIRVVKNKENDIFIDYSFKADGRGAYVCKDTTCISNCEKTHALSRVFKCQVDDNIYAKLKEELKI